MQNTSVRDDATIDLSGATSRQRCWRGTAERGFADVEFGWVRRSTDDRHASPAAPKRPGMVDGWREAMLNR
jgi:hypothetical protein